jgi:hypothetical protein
MVGKCPTQAKVRLERATRLTSKSFLYYYLPFRPPDDGTHCHYCLCESMMKV